MPKHYPFRSLSVDELLEVLEDAKRTHGGQAQVIFSSNYGDYHNTPQAHAIEGEIDEVELEESAYSRSGYAVCREDRDLDDDEIEYEPFLLLK